MRFAAGRRSFSLSLSLSVFASVSFSTRSHVHLLCYTIITNRHRYYIYTYDMRVCTVGCQAYTLHYPHLALNAINILYDYV